MFQSLWRFFGRFHLIQARQDRPLDEVSIALAILLSADSTWPTICAAGRRRFTALAILRRFHADICPRLPVFRTVSIALAILSADSTRSPFGIGNSQIFCFNRSGDSSADSTWLAHSGGMNKSIMVSTALAILRPIPRLSLSRPRRAVRFQSLWRFGRFHVRLLDIYIAQPPAILRPTMPQIALPAYDSVSIALAILRPIPT